MIGGGHSDDASLTCPRLSAASAGRSKVCSASRGETDGPLSRVRLASPSLTSFRN